MKVRHFFFVLCAILFALPAYAAPFGEGSGGGDGPTPTPGVDQAITAEVRAGGEAYLYPTAGAPKVGRVDPGDQVRVIEQLDDWYRIEVTERAMGRPVMPLADGWVGQDVFGEPLDGVPPASRPTAVPTATATPVATATPSSSPNAAPPASAIPSAAPEQIGTVPDEGTTPPGSAGGTDTTIPGSDGGSTTTTSTRQVVTVSKPIIIEQCVDANANRGCDVTEGIAGVQGYVLDARTGQVLGQSVSNERGITQIYVTTTNDVQLVINVPFLNKREVRQATDNTPVSIVMDDVAAIPGLIP